MPNEIVPEVYTGKDCDVKIGSSIGNWINYKLEISTEKEKCTPAKKRVMRQCTVTKHAKLTLEGYRGGTETFKDLALVDADVSSVELTDSPADWADFDNWRITDANMDQPAGPGKYTLTLEQGMVGTSTRAVAAGGGA